MALDTFSLCIGGGVGFLIGALLAWFLASRKTAKEVDASAVGILRTATAMLERYEKRRTETDRPSKIRIEEEKN